MKNTNKCLGMSSAWGATTEERADQLLTQLTSEEKIRLLGGTYFTTQPIPRLGIPALLMADGPQGIRADFDHAFPAGTAFPAGAALAATWDLHLAQRYGQALGLDGRARGVHFQLGPGVNLSRIPVNGRNFEYFGEDPLLAGKMAVAWVRGLQAEGVVATVKHFALNEQEEMRCDVDVRVDDRTLHEIYLAPFRYAVQEGDALAIMSAYNCFRGEHCTQSDLLQNKILKQQWGFPGVVMSDWGATHDVVALSHGLDLEMPSGQYLNAANIAKAIADGSMTQADVDNAVRRLLRTAVAMGFLDREQKRSDLPLDSKESAQVALDVARAAIVLLKNDTALLPLDPSALKHIAVYGPNAANTPIGGGGSGDVIPSHRVSFLQGIAAAAGKNVKITHVERTTNNEEWLNLVKTSAGGKPGLVLTIQPPGEKPPFVMDVPNIELAWKEGQPPVSLPVSIENKTQCTWIGVLDAPADSDWELINARYWAVKVKINGEFLHHGDRVRLTKGHPIPIVVTATIELSEVRNIAVALQPVAPPDLTAAQQADVVIVCVGLNTTMEGEAHDRSFHLPPSQQALIEAVAKVNPRTIVVLNSGAAVAMPWIEKIPALLQAWYLGQEGGTALGDVLFGQVNPSGRLCSTFDRAWEENPAYTTYPVTTPGKNPVLEYKEGLFYGYRGYDKARKAPLFPFGFGLSYTTFEIANFTITPPDADGVVRASVDVRNTGKRAGAQVVQIYVGQPKASVERPLRELKGFAKIMLEPGQSQRVTIPLPRSAFQYYSPTQQTFILEPGEFVIEAGANVRDLPCAQRIRIQ